MKFILINPDYMLYGDPPLGIATLAAYLRRECSFLDVKIMDQVPEKKMMKQIVTEKPEVVGLTAVSQNYYKAVGLAKKIREIHPNALLVIGGVHITTCQKAFEKSPFDLAVIGEGEVPAKNLFMTLERGGSPVELSKVPGFIIRDGDNIINTGLSEQIKNLDDVPIPARDLLNMDFYNLPKFSYIDSIDPIGAIVTSRGCPYACKFCSSSAFWRRTIRFHSAERVVREVKFLYEKYKYTTMYIFDDLFTINKERLRKIVELLEKENLRGKLKFRVVGRANCFDDETADLLKKMGVTAVTFGFETGSDRLLGFLKGSSVTIKDGLRAIDISKKRGFVVGGFFMAGAPTETAAELEETYEFIKKINLDGSVQCIQVNAFPGTFCWDYAVENKIIPEDFFEKEQKRFIELNPDLLLSKDMTKEEFLAGYYKIRSLIKGRKVSIVSKLMMIRPRHIKAMMNSSFLRKANILKKIFLENMRLI